MSLPPPLASDTNDVCAALREQMPPALSLGRVRRAWYHHLFPHFPVFSGPYPVGVHDFEWTSPDFDRAEMVTNTDTLFVRLFYPCESDSSLGHPHWLGKHEGIGYGDFMRWPRWLSWPVFNSVFALTRLPAFLNARLATRSPLEENDRTLPKFPVMVFSHGLGGCKGTYSYFSGDMASHGFVVMAIEHRDRSACITVQRGKEKVTYQRAPTINLGIDDFTFRSTQVRHRVAEVRKAVELAIMLNKGQPPHNHLFDRTPDTDHAADTNATTTTRPVFTGRLDLENMVACGHSFGGATIVTVLQQSYKSALEQSVSNGSKQLTHPFKCGFVMDPWMFPVSKDTCVTVPVAISNSETFQWPQNITAMFKIISSQPDSICFTVKGSAHQNHSDLPILLPYLMKQSRMGGIRDPAKVLQNNNAAGLSFMIRYLSDTTYSIIAPFIDSELVLKIADGKLTSLVDDVVVGWKWFDSKYGTSVAN